VDASWDQESRTVRARACEKNVRWSTRASEEVIPEDSGLTFSSSSHLPHNLPDPRRYFPSWKNVAQCAPDLLTMRECRAVRSARRKILYSPRLARERERERVRYKFHFVYYTFCRYYIVLSPLPLSLLHARRKLFARDSVSISFSS